MPSTKDLISKLEKDYPQFSFKASEQFSWSPDEKTIYFNSGSDEYPIYLMHELAHALLDHSNYDYDIELVTMEREAWDEVIKLTEKYNLDVNTEEIQSTLDTYRDWLHNRSTCPKCQANGVQNGIKTYQCLACNNKWRVNEARVCALRRYKIKK